jgi:hypothetical protein
MANPSTPKRETKRRKKPAATKKAAAAPSARTAAPTVKHPAKQISQNDLVRLLNRCNSLGTQASEIAGEMGNMVKQAVDGKNLDRKAFSIVRGLHKMSTQRLRSTLPALLLYIDMAGLQEKLDAEPELSLAKGDEREAEGNGGAESDLPESERDLRPRHLREAETASDAKH